MTTTGPQRSTTSSTAATPWAGQRLICFRVSSPATGRPGRIPEGVLMVGRVAPREADFLAEARATILKSAPAAALGNNIFLITTKSKALEETP
jgi:hypothetical protein